MGKLAVFNIYLFFIAAVVFEVQTYDDSKTRAFVDNVLDQVYKIKHEGTLREQEFLTRMMQRISSLIPKSVEIPRFRDNLETGYLCADATSIHIEPGTQWSRLYFDEGPQGNNRYIYATFELDFKITNPVKFDLYLEENLNTDSKKQKKKNQKNFCKKESQLSTITYIFNGENNVKFNLSIPNFSDDRNSISKECIVIINSITIESLSEPSFDNSGNKIGEQYWNSVKENDIRTMMRMGIMGAMLEERQQSTKFGSSFVLRGERWDCLSKSFMKIFTQDVLNHIFADSSVQDKTSLSGDRVFSNEFIYQKIDLLGFMGYVQIGIKDSIKELKTQPRRDVLVRDFASTNKKTLSGKPDISGRSPQYEFTTYAPVAFCYLREHFGVTEEEYVAKVCNDNLITLSNPGKSGSSLYLSKNKMFVIKSVQKSETNTLQTLLSGYFLNLLQNPDTLLPKFYGLYSLEGTRLRSFTSLLCLVMNNVMPSDTRIDQKYDLKGSTFQREASRNEKDKKDYRTFKDNDFKSHHSYGIYLQAKHYDRLMNTIQRDILVLESFDIIDYSLLLGLHYIERALTKEEGEKPTGVVTEIPCELEADAENNEQTDLKLTGMPAKTVRGEKLSLFIGFVDILQDYRLVKRLENLWKTFTLRQQDISVVDPQSYARRLWIFLESKVFTKMKPCPERKKVIKVTKTFKEWHKEEP